MTFETKVLRSANEIRAIKDQWQALEDKSEGVALFQSFEWCAHILELDRANGDEDYYVISTFEQGQLVALLPLSIWHKKGRKVLTGLGEPYQQYTEMLADPAFDATKLFAAMHDVIKQSDADYVHFGQVRYDGPLYAGSRAFFDHAEEEKAAPYVDLAQWDSYETYYAALKKATRKRLRNAYNRFEREGELAHFHAFEGSMLGAVIDRSFEGRVEWQQRMGLTSRAFQDDSFRAFLNRFKDCTDDSVKPLAFCLTLNGEAVADQWGFVYKDRYYAYMSTWNEEHAYAGPGRLHLGEIVKSCYDLGIKYVDFMIPSVPYKMIYATGEVEASDLIKPLSTTGFIYANIWLKHMRPKLKAIMQAMPAEQRKKIINTVFNRK
ncbi:hypothetical protein MXMO3_02552 [Maritalea myrionectae]|uniref:BioF2-like acetyltransferase domain-containing protein n=1 Tax=Maritalea myrionectae TaxID=454601 RepID=A0A2R4MGP7_9HYPH|nr:GNAT family N-acetyltransferase [Maritalea myrionectae]AVX05064.1 hypothetical protein MXMO3_02552 [Maritalea myrionectae]